MKKILIAYFAFTLAITVNAQLDNDNDYIYMKCGTKFNKSDFAKACASSTPKENKIAYDAKYKRCECMITAIAKHYTYEEMHGVNFATVTLMDSDLPIWSEISDCVLKYFNENYELTQAGEFFEKELNDCVMNLKNKPEFIDRDFDEFIFCNCITEEFLKRGFLLSDIEELEDENSEIYNEVNIYCLSKSGAYKETSYSSSNDVICNSKYGYVPLLNHGTEFKIKISIGSLNKYFMLDSGASDIMISTDFERELLLEGLVTKENYLPEDYYTLADGSSVKSRRILIDNVKIGEFTVNNVIMGVINSDNSLLLLGKSFLDKFNNYSIDNKNSTLYLEIK